MASGSGICNSTCSMTAAAAAATCSGQLMQMRALDCFPIQNVVVSQHAKLAAAKAVEMAARAESLEDSALALPSESDPSHVGPALHLSEPPITHLATDAACSLSLSPTSAAAAASATLDGFTRNNYRFALDLAPSLLLSLGPVVASIIKSGVGKKYLEFKALRATYILSGSTLMLLPASKGDIFSSQHLSLMDKRCLMKFFKAIGPKSDAGADAGAQKRLQQSDDAVEGVFLAELMTRHGLDERLQEYVAYGMAGVARLSQTSAAEGIASIGAYLQSMGVYGEGSPFLYCCYGSGEMAQAYCRMAAVYGGLYVLRRSISSIHSECIPRDVSPANQSDTPLQDELVSSGQSIQSSDNSQRRIKGVLLTDGQYVETNHIISSAECWPVSSKQFAATTSDTDYNLRAIIISTSPIVLPLESSANANNDPGAPILICIPPSSPPSSHGITSCVRLLQLGSSCQVSFAFFWSLEAAYSLLDLILQVCPDGYYILHAQCSVHAVSVDGCRQEMLDKVSVTTVLHHAL